MSTIKKKYSSKKSNTRKNNIYMQKKQKGGIGNDSRLLLRDIMKLKQQELSLDIIDVYKKMNNTTKANKYVIMACRKRISEQIQEKKKHKDASSKELDNERTEKFINFFSLIPNHLKKDPELVQLFLYYEPKLIVSEFFPKSLKRKEHLLIITIIQDPTVFYLLDKVRQRNILRKFPEILLDSTNKVNINNNGRLRISNLSYLARYGDAFGILLAALIGPQVSQALSDLVV